MAVYPAALFWPWCWGFVHVGVPPPREAGGVLRLRSRGRAAEQKNTVTLVPGALWPSLVYLLGPFSQCSEPWLPSDTLSNNLAGYLWDLNKKQWERNQPTMGTYLLLLKQQLSFPYSPVHYIWWPHFKCWWQCFFQGLQWDGSVIYFSGKKGVHPLPLVAENRQGCLEDPSNPCPFLGSVNSRGGTTSPCNEEMSGFTPRFWSGQHMHNQLIFFWGSLLGGVGRVANPVVYV